MKIFPYPCGFYQHSTTWFWDMQTAVESSAARIVNGWVPGQAMVHPTFLVNGFVQGIWTAKNTILQVTPFRPLSEVDAEALFLEAKRLLSFIADDSSQWKIALSRGKKSSRRTPPRSPPGT